MRIVLIALAITLSMWRPAEGAAIIHFDECLVGSCLSQAGGRVEIIDGVAHVTFSGRLFGSEAAAFNISGSEEGLAISVLTAGYSNGFPRIPPNEFTGDFEYYIAGPNTPPTGTFPSVSFTISRVGGFTSELELFEPNSLGYIAAVTFGYGCCFPDLQVADSVELLQQPTAVPEPGTLVLLATGLVAGWRTRKSARRRLT
jgi:hypothetical protein